MRRIGDEAALPLKSCVETTKQTIERCGKASELIVRILDWQALVDGELADMVRPGRHVRNRGQTFARQEVTADGRKYDGEGNEPAERDADISEQFTFRMK